MNEILERLLCIEAKLDALIAALAEESDDDNSASSLDDAIEGTSHDEIRTL